jgi:hypothetical protein
MCFFNFNFGGGGLQADSPPPPLGAPLRYIEMYVESYIPTTADSPRFLLLRADKRHDT